MKTLDELNAAFYHACAAYCSAREARHEGYRAANAADAACDAAREALCAAFYAACDAYESKLKEVKNESIGKVKE